MDLLIASGWLGLLDLLVVWFWGGVFCTCHNFALFRFVCLLLLFFAVFGCFVAGIVVLVAGFGFRCLRFGYWLAVWRCGWLFEFACLVRMVYVFRSIHCNSYAWFVVVV